MRRVGTEKRHYTQPRFRQAACLLLMLLAAPIGCEPPAAQPAKQPPLPAKETVRKEAGVGMGEVGRGYGEGPVATPLKALANVKEQIAVDLYRHALDIYKAMDPQGKGPKSHQEFMDKIIKANDIKLPVLPAGHRYVYDPDQEKLFVEQPKEPHP